MRITTIVKRQIITAIASIGLLAPAMGLVPKDAAGPGEFPGLQLLPVGSIIKGIVLPRYEDHRVTAILKAEYMKVVSRSVVELKNVAATLISSNGIRTIITTSGVEYSFATSRAFTKNTFDEEKGDDSQTSVKVVDPRFTIDGGQVLYCTEKQRGILIGPIRTSLSTGQLDKETADKKP